MLNQIILVGRLTDTPILETLESGKTICNITVAVQRSYKNADGVYETDFINCLLQFGDAENTCKYCKKGDLIGIKGKLQNNNDKLEVVAERVTFLS